MQLTIDLPPEMTPEQLQEVTLGAAKNMGWTDKVEFTDDTGDTALIDNPFSAFDFLKMKFIEVAFNNYQCWMVNQAKEDAGLLEQQKIAAEFSFLKGQNA